MEFFHKGSDWWYTFDFGNKKGENKTFQKHPKWPYLREPFYN